MITQVQPHPSPNQQSHSQRAHPSRKRSSRRQWMPWIVLGGVLTMILLAVLSLIAVLLILGMSNSKLPSDIAIAGLPVGGMSEQEAARYLQQTIPAQQVAFTDADRHWTLSLAQLGVTIDPELTIQRARGAAPGSNVQPYYKIDLNQAQMALVYLSDLVNIAAVSGNQPQAGRAIEIPVMLDRLRVDLNGELADKVLELSMIEVAPPVVTVSNNQTPGVTTTHIVERGQELGLIAKMYGVSTDEIVRLNNLSNPDVIYVGQELIIPAGGVYTPSAADAPPAPTGTGKAIIVSTSDQRIYAYQDGQLVRSHLVSTGLPATPTVLGDYHVYVKYAATDMRGADYFLPQVPWTMYFYQGYAIHGTYWHNSFGRPMSHGCVNLPPDEARWFFEWAQVGTLVRVI